MFRPLSLSLADACSGNVNSSAPPPGRVHSLCSETASGRDNRVGGGLGRALRMFSRSVPCPRSVQLQFFSSEKPFSHPYALSRILSQAASLRSLTQLLRGCAHLSKSALLRDHRLSRRPHLCQKMRLGGSKVQGLPGLYRKFKTRNETLSQNTKQNKNKALLRQLLPVGAA